MLRFKLFGSAKSNNDEMNPILNSSNDITEDLLLRIIDNRLDSLTINYEFTRRMEENKETFLNWKHDQLRTNPFWAANQKKTLKRLKFKIILGKNVHSLAHAFSHMNKLKSVNLNVSSNITDMHAMFRDARAFDQAIDHWDTSNVTDMSEMFYDAESFNNSIGSWDTSKVTDFSMMFFCAKKFNKAIDSWDTSKAKLMCGMFGLAESFNQKLGSWNTSNVTDMSAMFCGAENFNQPICSWNTSNVNRMVAMFEEAKSFNQPIENWDVSNVTDMRDMFAGADSFRYKTDKWDTSKVTNKPKIIYEPSDDFDITWAEEMGMIDKNTDPSTFFVLKPRVIE